MMVFASLAAIPPVIAMVMACCAASIGAFCATSPAAAAQTATAPGAESDSRLGFRELVDDETGVALRLPLNLLGPAQKSASGTAWSTPDRRLKIVALNFRNRKTLLAVYQAIRNRPGRTLSQDALSGASFELRGRDADGSAFFVIAQERNGEVRGLSIACDKSATPDIVAAAQTILQSFRGFPAAVESGAEARAGPEQQAKNAPCPEDAPLSRLADGVRLKLDGPGQIRAGESLRFSWEAAAKFPAKTPVYAILSVSGEARLEADARPEQDEDKLPGFIALRPSAPGPKGLGFGAGATRVLIPLHADGARLSGGISVRLYNAGDYAFASAVVARTACGEQVLKDGPQGSAAVAPASAEIVVQDPYDIAVPKRAMLSNDGHYLLQIFESYYRVFDVASGAKLVDRSGRDPNFSPTGRFVAANTGGGEDYEIVDLLSREPVASVSGLLIAWAEDDAFVIAAQAGSWASLTVRSTLISLPKHAQESSQNSDASEDSLSISVRSPSKNQPAWEAFAINVDIDEGFVAFSHVDWPDENKASKQASVYELASGREMSPRPAQKGWRARGPIRFSHIYNFDGSKTYNPEWEKEQAKSKTLKALRPLKLVHKALDPKALADLRKSAEAQAPSGDWRASSRALPTAFGGEASTVSFADELGRFGIQLAKEVPREEFFLPYSALRSTVDGDQLERRDADVGVQAFASAMKERLVREVPAAAQILKEGELTHTSINLASHLEGLWRWDVQGKPLWLLQGVEAQGSGGFAEINNWLLKGAPAGGKVETLLEDIPEGYNPHITDVDENAIRLKARLFLDRYVITGMSGPRLISFTDLDGQRPHVLIKDIPQADLMTDVRLTADARHIIQINSDGQFFFHDIASQKMALAGRYVDGEIMFYTPEAYYWSSYEGAHFVQLRFPGTPELASFRQFNSVLNRPDLVKAQLGQNPPSLPQPQLEPPPSLDIALADEPGREIRIRAHARARSASGLERLRLYYDGQLVKDQLLEGTDYEGSITLPRSPHARWLTALAADRKGVLSAARSLRLKPSGPGTNTLRAVLVGVDKYSSPDIDLTYAKSDATRLAAALDKRKAIYYAKQNVELLADGEATAAAIAAAMERAVAAATPEDTILFFFAGHGVQGDDGRYYLAPHDLERDSIERTGLPWSQIAAILAKTKARAVVILNSCHSGLSGAEGLATNDDAVKGLLSGAHAPVLVLAASKGRELSFEGEKWKGGVFTYALTKVLLDAASRDGGRDALDVSGLYRGLREVLAKETNGQQTPWLARQDLIGDFSLF